MKKNTYLSIQEYRDELADPSGLSFTEEQLLVFDFLVKSFPEQFLLVDPESSSAIDPNGTISVLSLMAYDIGNSREFINNLENAKDIRHLINSMKSVDGVSQSEYSINPFERSGEPSRFYENDRILAVLNSLDVDRVLFNGDSTVDKKGEIVENNSNYFLNAYSYVVNRGTLPTLRRVITDYLDDRISVSDSSADKVSRDAGEFTIEKDAVNNHEYNVKIDTAIDEDIDTSVDLSSPDYLDGEYFGIKKSSSIYKIIESVRPAGIIYTIGMLYKANILRNSEDEIFDASSYDEASNVVLLDGLTSEPTITNATYYSYNESTGIVRYRIDVHNPYRHTPVILMVRDFTSDTYYENQSYAKQTSHREVYLEPGETRTGILLTSKLEYDPDDYVYIGGYFKSTLDESEESGYNDYVAGETRVQVPSTPDPSTDPDMDYNPNVVASAEVSQTGGYASVDIHNDNNHEVTAHISYTYAISGDTYVKSETIVMNGLSSKNREYVNPYEENASFQVQVYFTAPGYNNSATASDSLSSVERTYLAQA